MWTTKEYDLVFPSSASKADIKKELIDLEMKLKAFISSDVRFRGKSVSVYVNTMENRSNYLSGDVWDEIRVSLFIYKHGANIDRKPVRSRLIFYSTNTDRYKDKYKVFAFGSGTQTDILTFEYNTDSLSLLEDIILDKICEESDRLEDNIWQE